MTLTHTVYDVRRGGQHPVQVGTIYHLQAATVHDDTDQGVCLPLDNRVWLVPIFDWDTMAPWWSKDHSARHLSHWIVSSGDDSVSVSVFRSYPEFSANAEAQRLWLERWLVRHGYVSTAGVWGSAPEEPVEFVR